MCIRTVFAFYSHSWFFLCWWQRGLGLSPIYCPYFLLSLVLFILIPVLFDICSVLLKSPNNNFASKYIFVSSFQHFFHWFFTFLPPPLPLLPPLATLSLPPFLALLNSHTHFYFKLSIPSTPLFNPLAKKHIDQFFPSLSFPWNVHKRNASQRWSLSWHLPPTPFLVYYPPYSSHLIFPLSIHLSSDKKPIKWRLSCIRQLDPRIIHKFHRIVKGCLISFAVLISIGSELLLVHWILTVYFDWKCPSLWRHTQHFCYIFSTRA